MEAKVGDRIVVESERVGQPAREGKVLEVLSPGPAVHYRVRWADDQDSLGEAAKFEFADEQAGHDRLAGARIVREKKPHTAELQ